MSRLRFIHETKKGAEGAIREIEELRGTGDPWAKPRQIDQGEYEGMWEYEAPPATIREEMTRDPAIAEYDSNWFETESIHL
jgi:hypothetical protein